ncbi:MAG: MFS transporter [Planctomycetes bacterium]|nr:MFS transporter [Planctomycetota bacterium]MCH8260454.1 MFS transporter [Planctomycetota bacterium]
MASQTARHFIGLRLSVMMFLQYAIWGAWLPLLYPYLLGHCGFKLDQVGMILAAGAVGAIFGPFIAGQVADRYFDTGKFLAVSHILGAVLVWVLASAQSFGVFLGLSLLYGLVYAPTLALTNSLCFHHLTDRDKQFGPIRLWGTIGWIVAGIAMGHWLLVKYTPEGTDAFIKAAQDLGRADAFRLSAILGLIMGIYCLTLPHTPPTKNAREANATLEAIKEVRRQPLLMLFVLAIPISVIHQFYFVHTSEFLSELQRQSAAAQSTAVWINNILGVGGGGLMTIGQMSEIAVLALMPLVAKQVSRKALLALGICAYAARMALFAYAAQSMPAVLLGVTLHGFCFGCFIFVAFMVVDEQTRADVRASAQNLFNLVIVGIGIIVGSWFATSIVGNWATHDVLNEAGQPILNEAGEVITRMNYTELFSVPMWASLACLLVLIVFYPRGKRKSVGGESATDAHRH